MEQQDLIRYINGDDSQAREILSWAESDPANGKVLEQLALASYAGRYQTDDGTFRPDKAWPKVNRKIFWRKMKPVCVSAAVLLLFVAGAWGVYSYQHRSGTENITLSSNADKKVQIELPDGTMACLNANTSITFPVSLRNADERRIHLSGEAYFIARHDAGRPLIVETDGGVTVTDLGTRFNVQAYPGDSVVLVSLLEGIVKAEVARGGNATNTTVLQPGERFFYNNRSNNILVSDCGKDGIAWMDNRLVFADTPLAEVARQLSHSQNVTVSVASPLIGRIRFSGTFDNRDIDTILSYIEQSCGVLPIRTGKKIVLSNKNNL